MSNTTPNLTIFTYNSSVELRTAVDERGETIVCLADLAHGLGISDVSRLASRLTDGVRRTHPIVDRLGRTQQATFVTEAGMNMVIWRSDKPEAIAYAQWCAERIAELRRTGAYATPAPQLSEDEIIHQALQIGENDSYGRQDQARIAGRGEEGHRGVARCRGGTEQIGSRSAIIDPGVHGRRDSASGDRRGAWRTPECDLPDSQPRLDCKYPACALQASGVPLVAQAPRLHQQGKKNAEAHRRQTIRLSDTRNSAAPAYGAAHPTANRSAA